ncbi:hypothetical protein CGLAMM_09840 [Acetobacteraceae bacterium EV16G]|uniref:Uncharacterized protein n=1 Tax=Sorlinia euscelidii TaxID=3081148 RepID=A0ABU7U5U9_9PROT
MIHVVFDITAWAILLLGVAVTRFRGPISAPLERLRHMMRAILWVALAALILSLHPLTLRAFITVILTALPGGLIAALVRYAIMPSPR